MDEPTAFNQLSLYASIASLILAVIAIGLSVSVLRKSAQAAEMTTEAARTAAKTTELLEGLLEKLDASNDRDTAEHIQAIKDQVADLRRKGERKSAS